MKVKFKGNASIAHALSQQLKKRGFSFKYDYIWMTDRADVNVTFDTHNKAVNKLLNNLQRLDIITTIDEFSPRDYIKTLSNNDCILADHVNREEINSTIIIIDNPQLFTLLSLRFSHNER